MQRFDNLSDNLKGAVVLVLAAGVFSLSVALIKLVGERIPVVQIIFLRQMGMMLMLSPVLIAHFPQSLKTTKPGLQFARVVFALCAMYGGFTAVVNMPLADATAIGFAKSFFVTIFAIFILHEVVGVYRWGAVVVGFIGVAIMLRPGGDGFSVYGLYALGGAAGAGLVMVIIRLLSRTEPGHTIMAYQVIGVGLVMLVPTIFLWVQPSFVEWLLIVAIAITSFFSQKANIYAYAHGEASLLASLDYLRLLFATVFGFFLFSQLPSSSTWIGALVVVAAALFTVYREAKRKKVITHGPGGSGLGNS